MIELFTPELAEKAFPSGVSFAAVNSAIAYDAYNKAERMRLQATRQLISHFRIFYEDVQARIGDEDQIEFAIAAASSLNAAKEHIKKAVADKEASLEAITKDIQMHSGAYWDAVMADAPRAEQPLVGDTRAERIRKANKDNANSPDLQLDENGVDMWGYSLEDHEAGRYRNHDLIYDGWNDPGYYPE